MDVLLTTVQYLVIGVYGIFALAIIGWALKDPILFLPLILVSPVVAALWLYEYRQWSAVVGFAGLLVQGLCTAKFETRENRTKELWKFIRSTVRARVVRISGRR